MHCTQALNLDLTCPLELQKKDCNKDNVAVVDGTGIRLVGTQQTDIVACASTSATYCQELPIRGLSALPITGLNIAGPPTRIYVQHTRGSNVAQVYPHAAPDWTQKRRQAAEAAAVDVHLLKVAIIGASGTGMLHYKRSVAQYFQSLPLCSAHSTWTTFLNSRTLARLQTIGPCKTEQTRRDNCVFFHSAELGNDFIDSTVLAFFKTANGHNRAADMRTVGNIARVSAVTDAVLFNVLSMTEMQLGRTSGITIIGDSTTLQPFLVGDVFTYSPPAPTPSSTGSGFTQVNITLLVPDPLQGPIPETYSIQYPTMAISLPFPGIYTIIEDSMIRRQGGETLSSRSKTYLNVQKRTATPAQINDVQIVTRVPLQYLQLTNMIIPSLPHDVATGQTPHAVIPSSVDVIDGLTDDTMFLLLQSIAPPCDRSEDWNRYNTKVIDNTMPCYVTHKISGSLRRVTYFRDILTRQTYASYVDWARTQ